MAWQIRLYSLGEWDEVGPTIWAAFLGNTHKPSCDLNPSLRSSPSLNMWSSAGKDIVYSFGLPLHALKIKSMLTPKQIIEKTHPAIWIKDKIDFISPEAKWICVVGRDPYQAFIASMKKHAGVQAWYDRVSLSEHNDFLGITAQNVSQFGQALLGSKRRLFQMDCSHERNGADQNDSPDRVLIVHFDDLVQRQAQTLKEVFQFWTCLPFERVSRTCSMRRRFAFEKQALKPAEVNEIDEILRSHNRAEWMKYRPEE